MHSCRREAKMHGAPRFNNGNFCENGHKADRYTSNGVCVECHREKQQDRRENDKEYRERERIRLRNRVRTQEERDRDNERKREARRIKKLAKKMKPKVEEMRKSPEIGVVYEPERLKEAQKEHRRDKTVEQIIEEINGD